MAECKGQGEVRKCVISRVSLCVKKCVCMCVRACVLTVEVTAEIRNLHLLRTSYKFSQQKNLHFNSFDSFSILCCPLHVCL